MKGVFKLRPSKPKYDTTWDADPVLEKMAKFFPLESLTLQELTTKSIILLALGTAHRVQTFSLISIENISVSPSGIQIRVPENIKTSRPGAFQPLLDLPFFQNEPQLCVARCLLRYIKVTESIRGTEKRLFISYRKPHKAISAQTISKWIKSTLSDCGVDESFTAHSTRHASTSRASDRGLSVELIKRTANWSQNSQVFAKFYKRPVAKESNKGFAETVLLNSKTKALPMNKK